MEWNRMHKFFVQLGAPGDSEVVISVSENAIKFADWQAHHAGPGSLKGGYKAGTCPLNPVCPRRSLPFTCIKVAFDLHSAH